MEYENYADLVPPHVAVRNKARKLRAMASLGMAVDKLHRIAQDLNVAGADREADNLHDLANLIRHAFENVNVPAINL